MAGQNELRGDLVELHRAAGDQRIVLPVDRTGLERGVEFGVGNRCRVGAERLAEELPELAGGHAQLDAGEIGRRVDLLGGLQVDLARAEVDRADHLDAELIARHLDEFLADVARERLLEVIVVAEEIGRGHQRPGRYLLGDVGRSKIAQLEILSLERDELGALLEQSVAPVGLEVEVVLHRCRERLVALGAQIGFGEGCGEAQLRFRLSVCPGRPPSASIAAPPMAS